ncbi:hypothetical protein SprV_0902712200 [Sparganum proliferum]
MDVIAVLFVYKAKRNTFDALVVHSALKELDKGCREYACAFLDYSSPFNTLPCPLLINKTSACGSAGRIVSWLRDYLRLALNLSSLASGNLWSFPMTAEFFKVPFYPLTFSPSILMI